MYVTYFQVDFFTNRTIAIDHMMEFTQKFIYIRYNASPHHKHIYIYIIYMSTYMQNLLNIFIFYAHVCYIYVTYKSFHAGK